MFIVYQILKKKEKATTEKSDVEAKEEAEEDGGTKAKNRSIKMGLTGVFLVYTFVSQVST